MKTDIFIITGFLGVGKTTLLKRILASAADLSKTVVLVNEFGKVGVDKSLIKRTAAADIVELSSGCICCSLKTDMIQTLQILKYDYEPERIIIEATGVADPLSIIDALKDRSICSKFNLRKTVTVVDSDFWDARESFGTVFKSQLKQADLILLNKIDLINKKKVESILDDLRREVPHARVIPSVQCNIEPEMIWDSSELELPGADMLTSVFMPYDPGRDISRFAAGDEKITAGSAGFVTFSFVTEKIIDQDRFKHFIGNLPVKVFRVKGSVKFPTGTEMLNFVGGKSQWQPWADGPTRLAFIGWDVLEEQVQKKIKECIIT